MEKLIRDYRVQKGNDAEDIVINDLQLIFPDAEISRKKTHGYDITLDFSNVEKSFHIEVKSAFDKIIERKKFCKQCKRQVLIRTRKCPFCNTEQFEYRNNFRIGHFSIEFTQLFNGISVFAFIKTYRDKITGQWNGKYDLMYVDALKVSNYFVNSKKRSHQVKVCSISVNKIKELKPNKNIREIIKLEEKV